MTDIIFHLAFPVSNLPDTKRYYVEGLGCGLGRESAQAVILNLYGHQLVAHVTEEPIVPPANIYPRHFGLVFPDRDHWQTLLQRAQSQNLPFYQSPKHRFPGTSLEHETFFLVDPFHNLMEYKYYRDATAIFGDRQHTQIGDR